MTTIYFTTIYLIGAAISIIIMLLGNKYHFSKGNGIVPAPLLAIILFSISWPLGVPVYTCILTGDCIDIAIRNRKKKNLMKE